MDWRAYWEEFPRRFGPLDYCQQVARTVNGGVPVGQDAIDQVVRQIDSGLALEPSDHLLDLCCGNGLLTHVFATRVSRAVGVDFSAPLIEVARARHASERVEYHRASVLDLGKLPLGEVPFTKVSMIESLQYFEPKQLPEILAEIDRVAARQAVCYFSGVLDRERIWSFFDTPERRASYEEQRASGKEIMGSWWLRREVDDAARDAGWSCETIDQPPDSITAHYRFDVRLRRG